MEVIKEILHALWEQDFSVLSDPKMIWAIYGILFTTLLLENGLLPAAFYRVIACCYWLVR